MSPGKTPTSDLVVGLWAFFALLVFFLVNWKRVIALLGVITLSVLAKLNPWGTSLKVSTPILSIAVILTSFFLALTLSVPVTLLCRSIPAVSLKVLAGSASIIVIAGAFLLVSSERFRDWLSDRSAREVPESQIVRVQWPEALAKDQQVGTLTWDWIVEGCLLARVRHFRVKSEVVPDDDSGSEITFEIEKRGHWDSRSMILQDQSMVDSFLKVGKEITTLAKRPDGTTGGVRCLVRRGKESWVLTLIPKSDGSHECWLETLKKQEKG